VKADFAESAPEAIAAVAAENAIDFVAMSTHGRTGLSQALLGSVATQVARRAGVPVILVGEGVPVVVRQR
jgi:nucleotide-binding universal stress UspA family protein